MAEQIRILGIAPYEGAKSLMERVAQEFDDVYLDTFVGNLEAGVEIAQRNFHDRYDLIISRGGTAQMLQEYVPLPVVEIRTTIYDILCALKLSAPQGGKVAVVGFPGITANASLLRGLIEQQIDAFTIQNPDEVEFTLRQIQARDYEVVLCDMIANTTAKRLGLDAFLIPSSLESVRETFRQARRLARNNIHLREENRFLRSMIDGHPTATIVLRSSGEVYLSSQPEPDPRLLDLLKHQLPQVTADGQWRALRNMNGMLYALSGRQLRVNEELCTAFYVSGRKAPPASSHQGIAFFSCKECEDEYYNSIYSVTGAVNELQGVIDRLNQSDLPIMISGEVGTGKVQVANMLYTTGRLKNHAMVRIDCALLDDKSWSFLLNHHDSPLSDADNTLFFQNLGALPPERRIQFLATMQDMDVCRRNRVLFSCVCHKGESASAVGAEFANALCCLTLYLPPLREHPERIPTLVNLYLSQLILELPVQILGTEPSALLLLRQYPWPQNYTQLRRVVQELATTAAEPTISAEDVRQALRKEKHAGRPAPLPAGNTDAVNLGRTLHEINQEIVSRVLLEVGGNRSLAAQRLGISRTTLWRMLQNA